MTLKEIKTMGYLAEGKFCDDASMKDCMWKILVYTN